MEKEIHTVEKTIKPIYEIEILGIIIGIYKTEEKWTKQKTK